MEEPPPRAEVEKGLPLLAELDVKSGGHVGGDSPTSGPGSPLMSMVTPLRPILTPPAYNFPFFKIKNIAQDIFGQDIIRADYGIGAFFQQRIQQQQQQQATRCGGVSPQDISVFSKPLSAVVPERTGETIFPVFSKLPGTLRKADWKLIRSLH
jgi:hypothetical protein